MFALQNLVKIENNFVDDIRIDIYNFSIDVSFIGEFALQINRWIISIVLLLTREGRSSRSIMAKKRDAKTSH
jgi:hypothetical protein